MSEDNLRAAALRNAARVKDADLRHAATAVACGLIAMADAQGRVANALEEWDHELWVRLLNPPVERPVEAETSQ